MGSIMASKAVSESSNSRGSRWLLGAGEFPPLGAHLVVARNGYSHHGIYVGNGAVMHYAGLSRGWEAGPVEELPLQRFARGRSIWVQAHVRPRFDPDEVVTRARSRLGEDRYQLLTNNCEHFCEWCIQGQGRSHQVEALSNTPRRALVGVLRTVAAGTDTLLTPLTARHSWAV
jgi:hypothetical protein